LAGSDDFGNMIGNIIKHTISPVTNLTVVFWLLEIITKY
jgi:hypothetical protein